MFQSLREVEQFFQKRKKFGIKPGLDRVHFLLERVHHPERHLQAVHVAGTNGKGSTIHLIKNALVHHQYVVGLFSSPSFTGIQGYFLINDKEIKEKELVSLMNKLLPHINMLDHQNMHPTEFEIITVIAFLYFKDRVDIALIETGMGGRYDTTNCFHPILSIITNVEKDHMQFLGETIEEIAYHKAGIIKHHSPIIVGSLHEESEKVIQKEAKALNAPLYRLQEEFIYHVDDNNIITWRYRDELTVKFSLQLKGPHQIENASLASMALLLLNKVGFAIDWSYVTESFQETSLPGRFEIVHKHPTIILDSAHNVAGIMAFLQTVEQHYPNKRKHLLFAGFKDKQLGEMVDKLKGHFTSVALTTFDDKRAATIQELQAYCIGQQIEINLSWQNAVLDILHQKPNQNDVYFITGSLHFITLVRQFLV
ncbi:bifunctional folylpolyglutamate synthase/dihydrofolate synthase [Pseudogracilibacillus auburnensis]|uniref:bifunctional folylpolyglutamate synthase/dihydrofolate synthase n=1 Tax=Pseudogracilibacillus auburnensis TaxID=1494959 RepID=UPI001A96207F|nr:Mur ligase family protein [Pseudogracilibacillus auburnensis]MBO1002598.1 bifunctional folylpolyglutamate synthase/dihydrofolate synthase [Pseudogracilibacillus auburnensis]